MRSHRVLIASLVLALALAAPAFAAKRLIIGGSTSVLPLAQKLASAYHKAYPSVPAPLVKGGQSDIGITGSEERRASTSATPRATRSRPTPKDSCSRRSRATVCASSRTNRTRSATSPRKASKTSSPGGSATGAKCPGAQITGPIDLFDRDGASGTQDAFQHIFLGETLKISPSATQETSNGLEQNAVTADKQAIGFVSFDFTPGVNPVGYEGIACNLRNAKSGQYLGVRNFWMVTKGRPERRSAEVPHMGHERQQDHEIDHQLQLDRDSLARDRGRARAEHPRRHPPQASGPGALAAPEAPRSGTAEDRRVELVLAGLAAALLALIALMIVTVAAQRVAVVLGQRAGVVRVRRRRRHAVPRDARRRSRCRATSCSTSAPGR